MYPLSISEMVKVTKCLPTASGLIGSLYSPDRVGSSPIIIVPKSPSKVNNIIIRYFLISVYPFTDDKTVRKSCKPIFYSIPLPSVEPSLDPLHSKMTCHRQLIFMFRFSPLVLPLSVPLRLRPLHEINHT